MTDVYNNVQSSLLKFCNDFIQANNLDNFQVFEFDAHASTGKMPDANTLGIAEFAMVDEGELFTFTAMVVVCTTGEDHGNALLKKVVGRLVRSLKPESILSAVLAETGQLVGHLIVQPPVEVLSVALTEGRPLVGIALQLKSSFLQPPG